MGSKGWSDRSRMCEATRCEVVLLIELSFGFVNPPRRESGTASSALCANEFDFVPVADTLSCLLPASPVECKWRSSCTDQNVKKRWQQLLHAIVDCACTSAKCRGLSTEGNRMESPFAACHHWHQ